MSEGVQGALVFVMILRNTVLAFLCAAGFIYGTHNLVVAYNYHMHSDSISEDF